MLNPQGYLIVSGELTTIERDTITCGHCGAIVIVKPGTLARTYLIPTPDGRMVEEPGAGCAKCARAICLACCDAGACEPFEKKLELYEAIQRHGGAPGPGGGFGAR